MSHPASPLEPRDIALLRDGPDAEPPPPEVRERLRVRVLAGIPMVQANGPEDGAGAAKATGRWVVKQVAVAVSALLVGGAGGAGLYARFIEPTAPQIVYVPQPVVVRVAPDAPASNATLLQAVSAASGPGARASSSAPSASPWSHTSQLTAERVLLDEARAALVEGDPGRALDRLARHRRTFASPILGEERDAMEVEALVRAGRPVEARAKADAFRRRMPSSLFLPVVESAIESIP